VMFYLTIALFVWLARISKVSRPVRRDVFRLRYQFDGDIYKFLLPNAIMIWGLILDVFV